MSKFPIFSTKNAFFSYPFAEHFITHLSIFCDYWAGGNKDISAYISIDDTGRFYFSPSGDSEFFSFDTPFFTRFLLMILFHCTAIIFLKRRERSYHQSVALCMCIDKHKSLYHRSIQCIAQIRWKIFFFRFLCHCNWQQRISSHTRQIKS